MRLIQQIFSWKYEVNKQFETTQNWAPYQKAKFTPLLGTNCERLRRDTENVTRHLFSVPLRHKESKLPFGRVTNCHAYSNLMSSTYAPPLEQKLAFAQAVGTVGKLDQGLLSLQPGVGVRGLVQLLAQDL